MADERPFMEAVAAGVARALGRIADLFGNPQNDSLPMLTLLRELGWDIPLDTDLSGSDYGFLAIVNQLKAVGESEDISLGELINALKSFLRNRGSIGLGLEFGVAEDFKQTLRNHLPRQLADYAIIEYFEDELPAAFGFLVALGIFRIRFYTGEEPYQIPHIKREIRWGALKTIFSQPNNFFENSYGWGTSSFDGSLVLDALEYLFNGLELETGRFEPDESVLEQRSISGEPLFLELVDTDEVEAGIEFYRITGTSEDSDVGLALAPYLISDTETSYDVLDSLRLVIDGSLQLRRNVGIELKPASPITLFGIGNTSLPEGRVRVKVLIHPRDGIGHVGNLEADNLAILEAVASLWAQVQPDASELGLEFGLGIRLVLGTDGADNFIQKILSGVRVDAELDLVFGIGTGRGFYLQSSGGLEIHIPIHRELGPIKIDTIYLSLAVGESGISITLASSLSGGLGPIAFAIDRIGIQIQPSFDDDGLNSFDVKFHPPRGAGLVINASSLTGGGYVEFDPENASYAGILQLSFGKIELVAIGLITTRMPDGQKGFSMLLIITAEFDPPITLPYNFNLSGVGGLVGIHRTMLVDVLRDGIKNHTVDSILFPEDPILNAPRIISDLRAIFPPAEGRYVLGPMAILNWGNPPLIRAEIGILIELPSPIRIAILGQLTLELPKSKGNAQNEEEAEESVLVEIHLDVLGILDFDKKTFSLDATLYDSRIIKFTLSGDSAMRLSWGDKPGFALSVGGLHPRFTPPPNFPNLRRLQLSIGSGNNPRINLDNYMAVTSNSLQFGARLEVYASKGDFDLHGYLGFDVLFIFSPFSFTADIGGGVSVKKGKKTLMSITLDLALSGPKPWHAKGKATFEIFCIKVRVRFDETWGSGQPDPLPPIDPWPRLKAALEDSGNWGARLSDADQTAVTLQKPDGATPPPEIVIIHPIGALEIHQQVLPLNLDMDLYGNAPIAGPKRYSVSEMSTGTGASVETIKRNVDDYGEEYFAAAQFVRMSDSEKLSRPSFEMFDASILAGAGELKVGTPVDYSLEYEMSVIDEEGIAHPAEQAQDRQVGWKEARYHLMGSARRAAAVRNMGLRAYAPLGAVKTVAMSEEAYRIINTTDMTTPATAIAPGGTPLTHAVASRILQDYLEAHPESRGQLQVVPDYEAA